jgi:hypothetical protein
LSRWGKGLTPAVNGESIPQLWKTKGFKMKKQMTRLGAFIDFFGLRPGQTKMQFLKEEIKALTDADRAEIEKGLQANGYEFVAG